MTKYHVALWRLARADAPDYVPSTVVEANDEMEARALALGEFRRRGVEIRLDNRLDAKLSTGDADRDEQDTDNEPSSVPVSDLVAWAQKTGRRFVSEQGLEWLPDIK